MRPASVCGNCRSGRSTFSTPDHVRRAGIIPPGRGTVYSASIKIQGASVMRNLIAGVMFIALSSVASSQVSKEQLAKPPATATHYVIQSTGSKHGDSYRWTTADGTHMA